MFKLQQLMPGETVSINLGGDFDKSNALRYHTICYRLEQQDKTISHLLLNIAGNMEQGLQTLSDSEKNDITLSNVIELLDTLATNYSVQTLTLVYHGYNLLSSNNAVKFMEAMARYLTMTPSLKKLDLSGIKISANGLAVRKMCAGLQKNNTLCVFIVDYHEIDANQDLQVMLSLAFQKHTYIVEVSGYKYRISKRGNICDAIYMPFITDITERNKKLEPQLEMAHRLYLFCCWSIQKQKNKDFSIFDKNVLKNVYAFMPELYKLKDSTAFSAVCWRETHTLQFQKEHNPKNSFEETASSGLLKKLEQLQSKLIEIDEKQKRLFGLHSELEHRLDILLSTTRNQPKQSYSGSEAQWNRKPT